MKIPKYFHGNQKNSMCDFCTWIRVNTTRYRNVELFSLINILFLPNRAAANRFYMMHQAYDVSGYGEFTSCAYSWLMAGDSYNQTFKTFMKLGWIRVYVSTMSWSGYNRGRRRGTGR